MLYEEIYHAMSDIEAVARREKVPGPLGRTMLDVSGSLLDLCERAERVAVSFAFMVLNGPTNLRATTAGLPEDTSCWRLIGLLEYLANIHG